MSKNIAEYEEDDTPEDVEAKNLLNKFIGSQVILRGMESVSSHPSTATSTSTVKRTSTKVTTTITVRDYY